MLLDCTLCSDGVERMFRLPDSYALTADRYSFAHRDINHATDGNRYSHHTTDGDPSTDHRRADRATDSNSSTPYRGPDRTTRDSHYSRDSHIHERTSHCCPTDCGGD